MELSLKRQSERATDWMAGWRRWCDVVWAVISRVHLLSSHQQPKEITNGKLVIHTYYVYISPLLFCFRKQTKKYNNLLNKFCFHWWVRWEQAETWHPTCIHLAFHMEIAISFPLWILCQLHILWVYLQEFMNSTSVFVGDLNLVLIIFTSHIEDIQRAACCCSKVDLLTKRDSRFVA